MRPQAPARYLMHRQIDTMMNAAFLTLFLLAALTTAAQTNSTAASSTNVSPLQLSEQIRSQCIEGRRTICGRILRILPEGLIVESGYTNLLREPLTKSWLVPGNVTASRADNLVESKEPNAVCVGTVFLTDLPRGKPNQYDYVILSGYPAGTHTYTSVGDVRKTVRHFSASLEKAVKLNFANAKKQPDSHPTTAK